MYAVGLINAGNKGVFVPCGNAGLQKLRNKSKRGQLSETKGMQKQVDFIAIMADFTQEMCEMSPYALANYVIDNALYFL